MFLFLPSPSVCCTVRKFTLAHMEPLSFGNSFAGTSVSAGAVGKFLSSKQVLFLFCSNAEGRIAIIVLNYNFFFGWESGAVGY